MEVVDLNSKRKKEPTAEDYFEGCRKVVQENIHKIIEGITERKPSRVLTVLLMDDGEAYIAEFGGGNSESLYMSLDILKDQIRRDMYDN